MTASARDRFLALLSAAIGEGTLVKLTLGKHRGADDTLQNLFVRPVTLKSGPHFAFVWRHATRDITKNHAPAAALTELAALIGASFLDAHLFTPAQTAQLECQSDGSARLKVKKLPAGETMSPSPVGAHDSGKNYLIPPDAPWLRALGVTNDRGQPREGMADKFRQIQKFAELLSHLLNEAGLDLLPPLTAIASVTTSPLKVIDAGSGKGYLTFAVSALLGDRAAVRGIEARQDLVALCNEVAVKQAFAPRLAFTAGTIAETPLDGVDVLIALHACDTATDDALALGIAAGAKLIVVAPCCQKELRPQLTAPPVLAAPLRHGIFQERQAEFVTDALRAELLEWAGYRTKVFEFISTEHTAKNLMIAAIKIRPRGTVDDSTAEQLRAFARFYGIKSQALARQLEFSL